MPSMSLKAPFHASTAYPPVPTSQADLPTMRVLSVLSLAIAAMPVGAQFGMPPKQRSEPSRGDRRRLLRIYKQ